MNKENKNKLETIVSGISSMLIKEDIQFVEKSKYDELKFKLEEKDKIINQTINFIKMIKDESYQSSVTGICDTALEILERGKNGK